MKSVSATKELAYNILGRKCWFLLCFVLFVLVGQNRIYFPKMLELEGGAGSKLYAVYPLLKDPQERTFQAFLCHVL